ncbi:MAG: hypothetical protein QOF02_3193 [Blastocatellia bacterium]|nr:hypothetical protein [Blastocatellia bacterium]
MKATLLTLTTLLLFGLLPFHPVAAQQTGTVEAIAASPYRIGERLTYHVTFSNFINAAHIELLVAARGQFFNRDALQLRAHIETAGVVNAALYSINNDYTTYLDPASGLPFRTQQVIREGGRTTDTSSEYNQPVGTAAIPDKLRIGEFPGTYDFISALYRLRALALNEGSVYYFMARNDMDGYAVEFSVIGRQLIKTNVGSFNTIVTQLRVPKDEAANKFRTRIYFSDDVRHVPVLLTARHPSGEIRIELAGSELPEQTMQTTTNVVKPPVNLPPTTNVAAVPGSTAFPSGLPFNAGEQLNFNVSLGATPQPVGTISLQVRARAKYFNRDGIQLGMKAQTTSAAQRLYSLNDQINSYLDPNTLLPFRTELQLQEGRDRANQVLTIDQDRGNVVTDKGTRIEIPVGTHDMLSVIYALRSFNLAPPKRNAVSILINNRPRTLFITSLKREMIDLGGQKIAALQLSLTTDDAQGDRLGLRLWVSEDNRRLPLRITANTPLGPARADLNIIPLVRQ